MFSDSPKSTDRHNQPLDAMKAKRGKDNISQLTEQMEENILHDKPKEWRDIGIVNVAVSDLPDPEGIEGSRDFQKLSMEEMELGLNRLQEIQTTIDRGEGHNSEHWAEVDRQKGIDFENGYQNIYEVFYSDQSKIKNIRVNKLGETYQIENGRHRIWLAKRMGFKTLPMRVRLYE